MKFGKWIKYYVVATQGIVTIVVLLLLGFWLGRYIDKDSFWPGLLAALGAICGLVSFVYLLLRMLKEEGKRKNGIQKTDH